MAKMNLAAKRRARNFALQAVYQWQMTQDPVKEITAQFLEQEAAVSIDQALFQTLFQGVVDHYLLLDPHIEPILDRPITEVNQVELAILRLAAYELNYCPTVPYKVVLNEAIELAKAFGAAEAKKYVNGVLHRVAQQLRPHEVCKPGDTLKNENLPADA